jgi:hypothetical protein
MPKNLQLHVQLRGTKVWRRIVIPMTASFGGLHHDLQGAFDWDDSHLYEYRRSSEVLASSPHCESFDGTPIAGADSVKIEQALGSKGRKCEYVYDFGDGWIHDIKVEAVVELPTDSPWLLDGEGSAPPEDCSGIPGYERLLEIRRTGKDPWGEDPEEVLEWAGDWSPHSFDRTRLPR